MHPPRLRRARESSTFASATPSGSSVFFVSVQQLTNGDHDELSDLYRYDIDDGDLSLVSEEAAGANGAAKADWVRASVDGSRVYFTAQGRLLPGQGSEEGENLYFADAGGLQFVASTDAGELQISSDGAVALFGPASPGTRRHGRQKRRIPLVRGHRGAHPTVERDPVGQRCLRRQGHHAAGGPGGAHQAPRRLPRPEQ